MICDLCPRRCGAERREDMGRGVCRMPAAPKLARAGLHLWEEPCISGNKGSGAIFFSGCSLGCVFCQNGSISHGGFGKTVSVARLREIMEELKAQGAHNINLVNPTHFAHCIKEALAEPIGIPVVWNCGGYERVETLKEMEGLVDIYLPDLKYVDGALSQKYSRAEDYFTYAAPAILEMFRQTGPYEMDDSGMLRRGTVIRHLMLPGELENTRRVIDFVAENFRPGDVLFSLMSQYTPQENAEGNLARRVRKSEYRAATEYMANCGIVDGFLQEDSSAQKEYTPDFDLTGI